MAKVRFVFDFDSIKEVKVVAESLNPEIQHKIPKTDIEISIIKKTLFLNIEAKDVSSLRAACNSYLRWINTALNVSRTI